MAGRASRCALAALALAIAGRAAGSEEWWPFPGPAATYVAVRGGPAVPRGTFAPGAVGVEGDFAAGAWYREIVGLELAAGVGWTSGRERPTPTGASGPRDSVLTYAVDAAVKVAPWRFRGPYLLGGFGRYAFELTQRATGLPATSDSGSYQAPHAGLGYLRRISPALFALAEVRYVWARARALGASRDLSAWQLSIGLGL